MSLTLLLILVKVRLQDEGPFLGLRFSAFFSMFYFTPFTIDWYQASTSPNPEILNPICLLLPLYRDHTVYEVHAPGGSWSDSLEALRLLFVWFV